MSQKFKPLEQHQLIQAYAKCLLSALQKQGVSLSVAGENALAVKGKMTAEQKENVRLWKRAIIDELSPKCSNCKEPMNLINDGSLWQCRIGCESLEVKK